LIFWYSKPAQTRSNPKWFFEIRRLYKPSAQRQVGSDYGFAHSSQKRMFSIFDVLEYPYQERKSSRPYISFYWHITLIAHRNRSVNENLCKVIIEMRFIQSTMYCRRIWSRFLSACGSVRSVTKWVSQPNLSYLFQKNVLIRAYHWLIRLIFFVEFLNLFIFSRSTPNQLSFFFSLL
jgi:hypothetical protein